MTIPYRLTLESKQRGTNIKFVLVDVYEKLQVPTFDHRAPRSHIQNCRNKLWIN